MEKPQETHCKVAEASLKRPPSVGLQQHDILEKAKLWKQLKDQRFRGREKGRKGEKNLVRGSTGEFRAGNLFYMNRYRYTFVKAQRIYNTKPNTNNPKVNCGLQLIMICE